MRPSLIQRPQQRGGVSSLPDAVSALHLRVWGVAMCSIGARHPSRNRSSSDASCPRRSASAVELFYLHRFHLKPLPKTQTKSALAAHAVPHHEGFKDRLDDDGRKADQHRCNFLHGCAVPCSSGTKKAARGDFRWRTLHHYQFHALFTAPKSSKYCLGGGQVTGQDRMRRFPPIALLHMR